jgi:hypothetical protein
MARIERTFADIRALLKQHGEALPAGTHGQLLSLIARAENEADSLADSEGESASRAARILCDWSRQEDPRVVRKVTEAIGGGHASDLSLIFM